MERIEQDTRDVLNCTPLKFHAGISRKFTKRHIENFHDTTIAAASAAKLRAERKLYNQAQAIEKHQKQIEIEMKRIGNITQKLHAQQLREGKRLRDKLHYCARKIQCAFRRWMSIKCKHVINIQRVWKGAKCRRVVLEVRKARRRSLENTAARIITHAVQTYHIRNNINMAARVIQSIVRMAQSRNKLNNFRYEKQQIFQRKTHAATQIKKIMKGYYVRMTYLVVLCLICRIQAQMRGFLVRTRLYHLQLDAYLSIKRNVAAVAIQKYVRGNLVRIKFARIHHSLEKINESVECYNDKPIIDDGQDNSQDNDMPNAPPSASFGASPLLRKSKIIRVGKSKSIGESKPKSIGTGRLRTNSPFTQNENIMNDGKKYVWKPAGSAPYRYARPKKLPGLPLQPESALNDVKQEAPSPHRFSFHNSAAVHRIRQLRSLPNYKKRLSSIKLEPVKKPHPLVISDENSIVSQSWSAINSSQEQCRQQKCVEINNKVRLQHEKIQLQKRKELLQKMESDRRSIEQREMKKEDRLGKLIDQAAKRKVRETFQAYLRELFDREQKERNLLMKEERLMRLHLKLQARKQRLQDTKRKRRMMKILSQVGLETISSTTMSEPSEVVDSKDAIDYDTLEDKPKKSYSQTLNKRLSQTDLADELTYHLDTDEFEYGNEFDEVVDEQYLAQEMLHILS